MPINSLGYPYIKKLQRDNLLHAYNMPIDIIQCGFRLIVIPTFSGLNYPLGVVGSQKCQRETSLA